MNFFARFLEYRRIKRVNKLKILIFGTKKRIEELRNFIVGKKIPYVLMGDYLDLVEKLAAFEKELEILTENQ